MENVEKCELVKQEILDVLKKHDIGLTFFVGKSDIATIEMWDADSKSYEIGCTISSIEAKEFEGYIEVS